MSFTLPTDLEQFVEQAVSSGRFPSREALLIHAVRLLCGNCEQAHIIGDDPVQAAETQSLVRQHDAFMNSYAPSDEGLYDDFAG